MIHGSEQTPMLKNELVSVSAECRAPKPIDSASRPLDRRIRLVASKAAATHPGLHIPCAVGCALLINLQLSTLSFACGPTRRAEIASGFVAAAFAAARARNAWSSPCGVNMSKPIRKVGDYRVGHMEKAYAIFNTDTLTKVRGRIFGLVELSLVFFCACRLPLPADAVIFSLGC